MSISYFREKTCYILRRYFQKSGLGCNYFSIWNFPSKGEYVWINRYIESCNICRAEWMPSIIWFVLALSSLGMFHSVLQFARNLYYTECPLTMWRSRQFFVLSAFCLRRIRLFCSVLLIQSWLLLMYGVVALAPNYMAPWLIISGITLAADFLIWLFDIILRNQKFKFRTVFSFLLPFICQHLVRCVKSSYTADAIRYKNSWINYK